MEFLIIAGLVLVGLRAVIGLRGASYRGRERRSSGAGARRHS
jgi:uncharacterized membrane protein